MRCKSLPRLAVLPLILLAAGCSWLKPGAVYIAQDKQRREIVTDQFRKLDTFDAAGAPGRADFINAWGDTIERAEKP